MKEQAKVNFGMANASMKWHNHVTNILQGLQDDKTHKEEDDEDEESEDADGQGMIKSSSKLPDIHKK